MFTAAVAQALATWRYGFRGGTAQTFPTGHGDLWLASQAWGGINHCKLKGKRVHNSEALCLLFHKNVRTHGSLD